jgi:hypothetical protein
VYKKYHTRIIEEETFPDAEDLLDKFVADVANVDLVCGGVVQQQPSGRIPHPARRERVSKPAAAAASSQPASSDKRKPSQQHWQGHKGKGASVSAVHARTSVSSDQKTAVGDGQVNVDCYISLLANTATAKPNTVLLVDSGATHHCVRDKSLFTEFRPGKHVVRVANGKTIAATGKGEVILSANTSDGEPIQFTLKDVFYVPTLTNNIFSTNRFIAAGSNRKVSLAADKSLQVGSYLVPLTQEHGLVWLCASSNRSPRVTSGTPSLVPTPSTTMSLELFHERMGHLNFADCQRLASQQGVKLTNTKDIVCAVCEKTKQSKQPIQNLAERSTVKPGEVIHVDIKGPIEDAAYNRAKFALVVVDEATRMCAVKDMKSKDQAVNALRDIFNAFATMPGSHPIIVGEGSTMHTDSEAVLKSKDMLAFLAAQHISTRAAPPYTHERNGIAERAIRTLQD